MAVSGMGKWFEEAEKDIIIQSQEGIEHRYYNLIYDNLWEDFSRTVLRHPNKPALYVNNEYVSYYNFAERIINFASGLSSQCKIKKGDVVALLMVNSIEFCISFYATIYLGAIALPLSTKLKSTELSFMLTDSKAKILITNPEWIPNINPIIKDTYIEKIVITPPTRNSSSYKSSDSSHIPYHALFLNTKINPPPIAREDGAVIMYTSGTTGHPKGAYLTHFNLLQSIISYERTLKLSSEDSTLIAVPIFHITGLAALFLLFMHIGGTIHLLPYFNEKKVLDILDKHSITFFHAAPTVYIMLMDYGRDYYKLPFLRKAACGGGPISEETIIKLKRWMPNLEFHTIYGLTETSSPATIFPTDIVIKSKMVSCGLPIPVVDCKIIDENGMDITGKGIGELCIRGPVVAQKYWHNEVATAQAFKDGWFKTGDIAKIDAEGYVYILDRLKDMINRGGEKIYTLEVENIIYSHPQVKEVAVIGAADPVYGEVARAIVIPNGSNISETDIQEWVKQRLAKYKVPKYVNFVSELPKNVNGKIDKKFLREKYQSV
ncbi:class I adenylate-forming enzyme family protein [Moorella sp. Hama-1]|uniref:class I adenylate-forming enzyme family protein n=1 Tax=Moorella sp. Hama-1 TaxID=2138101 RepID=UPI000D646E67|nr:class I adenylate-forming enzyme family protein [Moorella sp. Hama-1]BCV21400.1 AMP-dependent ligase [Moorella sp. Hama-1]